MFSLIAESSNGCRICGSALGKPSLSADSVGQRAAKDLIEDINNGGAVDRYTQDQVFTVLNIFILNRNQFTVNHIYGAFLWKVVDKDGSDNITHKDCHLFRRTVNRSMSSTDFH